MADLSKELQGCATALPDELKRFVDRVALAVVKLCALVEKSAAEITALRDTYQRPVAREAEHEQASEEATESRKMIRAMVEKVADQLSACAAAAAPLDAHTRDTLHAGLAHAALGTHMAAEAKAELKPLLAAAEELQAAVKPTSSWLGAVVVMRGIFGRLVGVKRARE